MKKTFTFITTLLIVFFTFMSCDDDKTIDVDTTKDLVLDLKELKLKLGEMSSVKILQGNGTYKISASNKNIEQNLKGNEIIIKAKVVGDSELTVTDKENKKSIIKVSIVNDKFTLDKTELSLVKGKSGYILINKGSGAYEVSSEKADLAELKIENGKLKINASKPGISKVTITDKKTKHTVSFKLTVTYPDIKFSIDYDKPKLFMYYETNKTINITEGSGKYKVISSIDNVVDTKIEGSKIIITAKEDTTYDGKIKKTTITIKDIEGGKTKEFDVEVSTQLEVYELEQDTEITTFKGFLGKGYDIIEGNIGAITMKPENPSIVEGVIKNKKFNEEQKVIQFKGLKKGETTVIISDGITSIKVKVKVSEVKLDVQEIEFFDEFSKYNKKTKIIDTGLSSDENGAGLIKLIGLGEYTIITQKDKYKSVVSLYDDTGKIGFEIVGEGTATVTIEDNSTKKRLDLTFKSKDKR